MADSTPSAANLERAGGCLVASGALHSVPPVRECEENEFDSIRDPQLAVNPQQSLLDRVLLDSELLRDFPIAGSFRDQIDDLLFPRCQKAFALGVDDAWQWRRTQRID